MDKPEVKLKKWQFQKTLNGNFVLFGTPTNHPHKGSDLEIRTSRLLNVDFTTGRAETLNTIYLLEGVGEQPKA